MEPEFSDKGKDYPMVKKTEFWHLADEIASLVPSKNYTEFFTFIIRNLNLPYDYNIAKTLPTTLKEIKAAHAIRGDFNERREELRRIEDDVDKLIQEFEASHVPVGFFGSDGNEIDISRYLEDRKPDTEKFGESAARKDLLEHGTDITALAREGHIDDCIGRDNEIWATTLTLARRKKANPVLVGPAGVGKSQIVYGLANRIARGEAGFLNDWTIIEMSTTGLNAGTKYVGELEKKMKGILAAIKKCPKVIIFIDEIHTIMGTGKGEKSTLDLANILKPALASGDLKLIGATTKDEYNILVKDPAVERRFNKITVDEPTLEEAIEVLHGIKKVYAKHHGVTYYKAAVDIMPVVAKRYNPKRNLPDSAVDILDYCGALARVSDIKKITKKMVGEFARKLYNLKEDEVVDLSPLKDHEKSSAMTIGFKPMKK